MQEDSPRWNSVEQAVEFATQAHKGQLDKQGCPYIEHPLRVMSTVDGMLHKMTGVLHDVLEDTPVTADELAKAGCPERVVAAVVALTKSPAEPLESYLARVAADPIALTVKYADIADNTSRLHQLDKTTRDRLQKKYATSLQLLQQYS